ALIQRVAIGLAALFVLLGVALPARFPKRAILHYADVRDLDMIRRSSYPLGTRARRGFYRAARVAVGVSGPVKKGGLVSLRARPGCGGEAVLASPGAAVLRTPIPGEDDDEFVRALRDGERPRVPTSDGRFRVSPGVGHEIQGTGLVFWYK